MLKTAIDLLVRGAGPVAFPVPEGDGPAGTAGPAGAAGPAYQMIAGLVGEPPVITRSSDYPFRADFRLLDDPFTVRMESWLSFDTFRRAGPGHVIRGRDHVLTVERGVSLVWCERNARPSA